MTNAEPKTPSSQPAFGQRDLDVLMKTAAVQSRKLARSLRLSVTEQEDVEQELLVALLERWRYFDASRGSSIAFAIRIARQASQGIADRIAAGWQNQVLSLDAAFSQGQEPEGEALRLAELIADETLPDEADVVATLAMHQFVETLPAELCTVVTSVFDADGDTSEAQQDASLSSSEFHRRLRELRYRLVSLELAPRRWLDR